MQQLRRRRRRRKTNLQVLFWLCLQRTDRAASPDSAASSPCACHDRWEWRRRRRKQKKRRKKQLMHGSHEHSRPTTSSGRISFFSDKWSPSALLCRLCFFSASFSRHCCYFWKNESKATRIEGNTPWNTTNDGIGQHLSCLCIIFPPPLCQRVRVSHCDFCQSAAAACSSSNSAAAAKVEWHTIRHRNQVTGEVRETEIQCTVGSTRYVLSSHTLSVSFSLFLSPSPLRHSQCCTVHSGHCCCRCCWLRNH